MAKTRKLKGMTLADFHQLYEKQDGLRPKKQLKREVPRLIPVQKAGDETALASMFLSALGISRHLQESFFEYTHMGFSKTSKVLVYSEVQFPGSGEESRVDGLVLIVRAGKIKDSAIIECKAKGARLDEGQVGRYLKISKDMGVDRVVTISNDFVSDTSQSPTGILNDSLFHLSWIRLRNRMFLLNRDMHEDSQIVERQLLKELVRYMDEPRAAVTGFSVMSAGWKSFCDAVRADRNVAQGDRDAVARDWEQYEHSLAYSLSRRLAAPVSSVLPEQLKASKSKNDFEKKIAYRVKGLEEKHCVSSSLAIEGLFAPVNIFCNLKEARVEMSVSLTLPPDRDSKAKIKWLVEQISTLYDNSPKDGRRLFQGLHLDFQPKYSRKPERFAVRKEGIVDALKDKKIERCEVIYIPTIIRADLANRKKVVQKIEQELVLFYRLIVQYLKEGKPKN